VYKLSYANLVANAVSHKGELANISLPQSNLRDQIKEELQHDSLAQTIIQLVKEGKIRRFWKEDGLILIKDKRIYVPSYDNLGWEVTKECHDSKWAGHLGILHTLGLVGESDC